MMVFLWTRVGKNLIWQKFSETRESDFNGLEKLLLQSDDKPILNRSITSFPLKLFDW